MANEHKINDNLTRPPICRRLVLVPSAKQSTTVFLHMVHCNWRGVSTRRSRLVISACADSVSSFTSTDTPSNMAEAAVVQDPADSFMLGWLTLTSTEESSPIMMANRMVELLCWYIMQQLLSMMAGFAESPADKQLNWRAILTGTAPLMKMPKFDAALVAKILNLPIQGISV